MSGRRRMVRWAAAGAALWAGRELLARSREVSLRGRVALVTGGSRGLGLELARRLLAEGCRVAVCARDEAELTSALRDLEGRGAPVFAGRCDVADREQVEAFVARVTRRFGHVDVLVNNAGIIQVGPVETMTVDDFRRALEVNFLGALYATLAVLPQMRRRGEGRIVNVTSIGGKVAVPHLLPYDCAKFALVGLSEGLRAELADRGITVTTIVPGLMRTGSPANALFKGDVEAEWSWFSVGDATPLTSMDAERAARRIVVALKRGEAEVTLGWQAKLLRLAHDLAPGVLTDLLGRVDRLLPEAPEEGGEREVRGMEVATGVSPSPLTALSDRAALRNNEYAGAPEPSPAHAAQAGLAPEAEGR